MQDEPEATGTHESGPRTIAASANPGSATPAQAYEAPQVDEGPMPSPRPNGGAGAAMPAYVYAIGTIAGVCATLSCEKEFAQATGRAETAGLTDRQALHEVLSQPQNRYLARQLCWVLRIEGLDTYIILPQDPADLDQLIESQRATQRPTDIDVLIGVRGPIAPPQLCNGLMVPTVVPHQIYSFNVDALIKSIPRPEKVTAKDFEAVAEELFHRIMQMADNAGATDEHRGPNYLAVRSTGLYHIVADAFGRNFSLTAVEARPSRLSGADPIIDVILRFMHRQTGVVESHFTRVAVAMFPYQVTPWSDYYDQP